MADVKVSEFYNKLTASVNEHQSLDNNLPMLFWQFSKVSNCNLSSVGKIEYLRTVYGTIVP